MDCIESSAVAQQIKVLSLGELQRIPLLPLPYPYTETLDWEVPLTYSIDGGGVRGVSALLILEAIMENLREMGGLGETPRPCEYFDLIGGTSTGGLVDSVAAMIILAYIAAVS